MDHGKEWGKRKRNTDKENWVDKKEREVKREWKNSNKKQTEERERERERGREEKEITNEYNIMGERLEDENRKKKLKRTLLRNWDLKIKKVL